MNDTSNIQTDKIKSTIMDLEPSLIRIKNISYTLDALSSAFTEGNSSPNPVAWLEPVDSLVDFINEAQEVYCKLLNIVEQKNIL